MSNLRPTIYLLAEMNREAGCSRKEVEQALLQDCPEEAHFIRLILEELYAPQQRAAEP